jgi:topoisomerase-4 subunit A
MVVYELPPGTSAKKVLEEIEAITNPQPRTGKKSLTLEQAREKQLMLAMLDKARDESDRAHPIRLVFEPRTSKIDETEFVNLLLAKTGMEGNIAINLVMVGLDGRPTGKNLREVIAEWIKFRFATVTRRTQHRLAQVLDRTHVLEGRMIVLLNVDKVIKIIRNADDPKAELIKAFKLSERQADDILDIRLRQLAKLEQIRIEQELKDLQKEQKGLEKILKDRKALEDLVVSEIEDDVKTFGDKRRTRIEESEKAVIETPIIDEPVTVIFSKKGWVRARQGWEVDPATLSFKEGDSLLSLIKCRTVEPVIFLDSKGRAYSVEASQLPPARGDGVPASSLVEVQEGAHILYCLGGKPETPVLVASTGGYGFLSKIADMVSNRKAGREFMTLDETDTPVAPFVYEESAGNFVAALSERGRLLLFAIAELKYQPRGRGTIVMGLDEDDRLFAVVVSDQPKLIVRGVSRNGKEKELLLEKDKLAHHVLKRARMGRVLPEKLKPNALVVSAKPSTP